MTKRVFITGAAGFIGFHLARSLALRGDQVLGYDNFNSYYDPELKRDRASNLKGIKIVKGDLCDYPFLDETLLKFKPTHIVNLAAQAGVRYSLENPREYLQSNVDGFFNILEFCREFPDVKLLYASSSSVYGNNTKTPFEESDSINDQASFYGTTKKMNEMMADMYHKLYGISAIGLRFFTVYGEWGRPDMAYFSFTKKIINNEPIEVYGEGELWRDFTYIDDIISGTTAALDLGAGNEIFNLGNNHPHSVNELIDILEQSIGKKAIRINKPLPVGDVHKTYADITKSSRLLGYDPQTSLEMGIPKFISWYRKQMS